MKRFQGLSRARLLVEKAVEEFYEAADSSDDERDNDSADTDSEETSGNKKESDGNAEESDAESELTEEQKETLLELDGLIQDWSNSPIKLQRIDENKESKKLSPTQTNGDREVPEKNSLSKATRNLFSTHISNDSLLVKSPTNLTQATPNLSTAANAEGSDAESELTEEQKETLLELNELVKDWSNSPIQLPKNDKNEEVKKISSSHRKGDGEKVDSQPAKQSDGDVSSHVVERKSDEVGQYGFFFDESESPDPPRAELEEPDFYNDDAIPHNDEMEILMNNPIWRERFRTPDVTCSTAQDSFLEPDVNLMKQISAAQTILTLDGINETGMRDTLTGESNLFAESNGNAATEQVTHASVTDQKKVPKEKKVKKQYKHKAHYCLFCEKSVTCFTRHIQSNALQHKPNFWQQQLQEDGISAERKQEILDVLELLKLAKEYSQKGTTIPRKQQISAILKGKGSCKNNKIRAAKGLPLLPARELATNSKISSVSIDSHSTCPMCHELYGEVTLNRHMKKCRVGALKVDPAFRKMNRKVRVLKKQRAATREAFAPYRGSGISKLLRKKVFPIFKRDETSLIAKNDKVICLFGSEIVQNHLTFKGLRQVATRMRELARLLIELRQLDPSIKSLSDALIPSKFKFIVEATRKMCRYNEETGTVEVVSLPKRIGTSVKLCITLNMFSVIEAEDSDLEKATAAERTATLMTTLFANRWSFNISSNAEKSRKKQDLAKPQVVANNNDVKLLTQYLEDLLLFHYSELQFGRNILENFEILCKILIALIIIYNRRRAGEAARIELPDYLNRDVGAPNEEIVRLMTAGQKAAMQTFSSFNILGKRTRCVPVLITKHMEHSIDLLIELRNKVGISEDNQYLFPRLYTDFPHDGTKILREFRNKINLEKPSTFTSRGLRKNIATNAAVHGVEAKERDHLSRSMGHDPLTHELHYNVSQKEVERGVVGEFLLAAARGEFFKISKKHQPTTGKKNNPSSSADCYKETHDENEDDSTIASGNDVCMNQDFEGQTCSERGDEDGDKVFSDHDSLSDDSDAPIGFRRKMKVVDESEEDSQSCLSSTKSKIKKRKKSHQQYISNSSYEVPSDKSTAEYFPKSTKKYNAISAPLEKTQGRKRNSKAISNETRDYILKPEKEKKPKRRWSKEERKAVKRQLKDCMDKKLNPNRSRSERCIAAEPILEGRTWTQVNGLINNYINNRLQEGYFSDLSD